MSEERTLNGYRIDLPEGRHVWVAKDGDSYFIQLCNAEAQKTHLRLSIEAGEALRHLLRADGITAAEEIKSYLFQVAVTQKDEQPQFKWELVKADTAPVVGAEA